MNATSVTPQPAAAGISPAPAEIDASCRLPLLVLFLSAALWLVVSSAFGLIASIKFHNPGFLSDCAWLTYGRVRAVSSSTLLYGFAVQAGLGVALWVIARSGAVRAAQPWLIALGGKLWNLGVLVGVIAILRGFNTGFENLEMPQSAALIMALGYLMIAVWTLLTLHFRTRRSLSPSQWFLLAALFWFPWIYSTANLLLIGSPVRGMTQAVIAWWYSADLNLVWFGLVGLAATFYFLPEMSNRPLRSRYLALFTFWTLLLFASWSGVPTSAPTPAWIPALSTIGTVLTIIPVLAVWLILRQTLGNPFTHVKGNTPGLFIAVGVPAFLISWLMNAVSVLPGVTSITTFTWFPIAQGQLNVYGFFSMTMFGAIYYIVPRVTGIDWPCAKSPRRHFLCAVIGLALIVLPLAIGGILQGLKLNDASVPFARISAMTLHFLRLTTVGELLLLAGHLLLLLNLTGLAVRYTRGILAPFFTSATAELKPAEVHS